MVIDKYVSLNTDDSDKAQKFGIYQGRGEKKLTETKRQNRETNSLEGLPTELEKEGRYISPEYRADLAKARKELLELSRKRPKLRIVFK